MAGIDEPGSRLDPKGRTPELAGIDELGSKLEPKGRAPELSGADEPGSRLEPKGRTPELEGIDELGSRLEPKGRTPELAGVDEPGSKLEPKDCTSPWLLGGRTGARPLILLKEGCPDVGEPRAGKPDPILGFEGEPPPGKVEAMGFAPL